MEVELRWDDTEARMQGNQEGVLLAGYCPRLVIAAVTVLVMLPALSGQTNLAEERELLYGNAREKTSVEFRVDKAEYFPGERQTVFISVFNKTTEPLRVLDPFSDGPLYLVELGPDGKEESRGPRGDVGLPDHNRVPPSVTLRPKGGIQRQFDSANITEDERTDLGDIGVPGVPGRYRLKYSYGPEARAEFPIVAPTLDMGTSVRIYPDGVWEANDSQGPRPYQRFREIYALRWNGVSWLCVSYDVKNGEPRRWDVQPGQTRRPIRAAIGEHHRVAQSTEPIVSITPSVDQLGNLTIIWKNSAGLEETVHLDTNLEVIR